jgi:hypothetical protein
MKTNPIRRIEPGLVVLLAAVGLGVFALFQAPDLFGEPAPSSPAYVANRERIEQMTQSERDRIQHRFEKFNELSAARQDELRKLHADLQTAKDGTKLQKVLKRYNDWLTSLSVVERDELRTKLRDAKTVDAQWQIVAQTKQKKDDERLLQFASGRDRFDYYNEKDPKKKEEILAQIREKYTYGARRRWGPTLKPDELDLVINVIADLLKPSAAQRAEWEKLKSPKRRLKIMIAALQEHEKRRRKREPGKREFALREPGLLSDAKLRQPMEEAVKDEELRQRLRPPPANPAFRRARYWILSLIKNTIDQERRKECGNPSDEKLSSFFAGLPEQRLETLSQQGSNRMRTLKWWYFVSGGENGEDYRKFWTEYYAVVRPFGFRGPRGGRKPGDGGRRGGRGRSQRTGSKPME